MLVNGKRFQVYTVDTVDTILKRIASELSTLPKWLVFSPTRPLTKKDFESDDLRVENYLDRIMNSESLDLPKGPFPPDVTMEEVQDIFIASNSFLDEMGANRSSFLAMIGKNLYKDGEAIWRKRDAVLGKLKRDIDANRSIARSFNVADKFERIIPVDTSPVELGRIQFTIDFGVYDGTLIGLFDSAVPDSTVPYVAYEHTFKIFDGFTINPEWLNIQLNNVIFLKVNSGGGGYTNAAFTITEEDGKLFGTIDSTDYSKRDEFTRKILNIFVGFKTKPLSVTPNMVFSKFIIPKQCMDTVAFADIVMLNDTINKFIVIDEFIKPSRTSENSVYIKRIDRQSAASIILKQTEKLNEYPGMRNIGEWYLMCRMRAPSEEEIDIFHSIIARIVSVYNNNVDTVIGEYRRILSSNYYSPKNCVSMYPLTKRFAKIKGARGLRAIDPDVFYPNYTRLCASPPVIVEHPEEETTNDQIMDFPIKGETTQDGRLVPTRTYTCKTPSHPFVGLRKSDLGNNDIFPYLPCCFAKDQRDRKGSPYMKYYFEGDDGSKKKQQRRRKREEEEEEEKIELPIIVREDDDDETRRRQLEEEQRQQKEQEEQREHHEQRAMMFDPPENNSRPGDLVQLPDQLTKFFKIMLMDPDMKYERCTIRRNKYAAIEAILYARGQISYRKMRISTVNNRVTKEVVNIFGNIDGYAMSLKQELYGYRLEDIVDLIGKSESWKPSVFGRMIELALDCSIFVFSADRGLVIPTHSRMHVKFRPTRETFFLYEHPNGYVDLLGSRQVLGPPSTFNGSHLPSDKVTKRIYGVFKSMSTPMLDFRSVPDMSFSTSTRISAQILDAHGKCRILILEDEFSVVPDIPLPPFAVKSLESLESLPRSTVSRCIARFGNIYTTRGDNRRVREVTVDIGRNIRATVLVDDSIDSIERGIERGMLETPIYENIGIESMATVFLTTKRIAMMRLYDTIRAVTDNEPPLSKENIDDKLIEYAHRHDGGGGGLTEDNKRLMYACRQWILTHMKPYRFSDATIVENIPSSFVLNGIDAVKNLLEMYTYDQSIVHDSVVLTGKPYYFRWKDKKVYLAIQTGSIPEAFDIISAKRSLPDQSPPVYAYIDNYPVLVVDGAGSDKILVVVDRSGRSDGRSVVHALMAL